MDIELAESVDCDADAALLPIEDGLANDEEESQSSRTPLRI